MTATPPVHPPANGGLSREKVLTLVLLAATVLAVYLCYQLALPFFNNLAWALSLAVVGFPLHRWMEQRVGRGSLAAGLSVGVVTLALVVPLLWVGARVVIEAGGKYSELSENAEGKSWWSMLEENETIGPIIEKIESQGINLREKVRTAAEDLIRSLIGLVQSSVGVVTGLVLTLFVLYYLFRDWREGIATARSFVPLSSSETDEIFTRIHDTIYATVFGTLMIAVIKGILGGLIFWILGISGVFLWGMVMALASLVPILGPFVVWAPASLLLAVNGEHVKAGVMFVYGATVLSLIDNVLYPFLVGRSLNMHTLPVFFAMLGGLAMFGAAGLVVGPVILAVTDALLEIWRRRVAQGRPAEAAAK